MPTIVVFKRLLDLLLYLGFCALAGTGLLMAFRLPPGSGERMEVLGLTRHDWGGVHFWIGAAFLAGIGMHLILNWNWLTKVAAQRHAWRLWLGLAAGATLAILPWVWPVKRLEGHGAGGGKHGGERIERSSNR